MDTSNQKLINAACNDVDLLFHKHDSRVLAAVLVQRAGSLYGCLRSIGYETDDSLVKIFVAALEEALRAEPPRVVLDGTTQAPASKQ